MSNLSSFFAFFPFCQTLAALPDQDSFYDMVDGLEEQGIETVSQRHLGRKGTDLDLVEQLNIYEVWDTQKDHKENIASWYWLFIKSTSPTSHPIYVLRWPYGMKTAMMTASLHQWDAGTAVGPVLGAGIRSAAWRGGGAAGPLSGDPVTPPPAALPPHREQAFSLSVARGLRTWARGEQEGKIEECQSQKVTLWSFITEGVQQVQRITVVWSIQSSLLTGYFWCTCVKIIELEREKFWLSFTDTFCSRTLSGFLPSM